MRRSALALLLSSTLLAQTPGLKTRPGTAQDDQTPTFSSSSNLVVLNVFVRDKNGKSLSGLKASDFIVTENGRPQHLSVFEFQQLGANTSAVTVSADATAAAAVPPAEMPKAAPRPEGSQRFRDRRLIVLYFDLSAMQSYEQLRAFEAAEQFIKEKLTPADLVAIMSFGTKLNTDLEFTDDRDSMISVIRKFTVGANSELATQGSTDVDSSDTASFSIDDTEFNIFNTDRKLSALEDATRKLMAYPEKKAIVYFSGGIERTGTENESQLRATVNSAVRSNVSFYPIDVTGLTAAPPGGDATTASPSGTALYTASAHNSQHDQRFNQQDTLESLASDTGGKAFFDSNDLALGIQQVQKDIESYYILGYYSSNENKDGRFRKVDVKLARKMDAKLDTRSGYYAEKEFAKMGGSEKERQLEDALTLGDPKTELPLALEVDWFRLTKDRFFVPVAVKIPGSVIPLKKKGSAETTDLDFVAEVRNDKDVRVSAVRDGIRVQLRDESAGKLPARSLTYDTGFTLTPGTYKLKFVARENLSGRMGTFQTTFNIPNPATVPAAPSMALSTLVLSNQLEQLNSLVGSADKRTAAKQKNHPLVRDGKKLVPSVTRVFRSDQTLYLYLEIYDPSLIPNGQQPSLAATVSFFSGNHKVYESSATRVASWLDGRGRTAALQLQIPLRELKPGQYTTQVNLVDEPGRRFAFPRAAISVLPPPVAVQPGPAVAAPAGASF